jgi:alkylhydroperoxidase family enzyme
VALPVGRRRKEGVGMARIKYLEKAEVGPEIRAVYAQMEALFGSVLNPTKIQAYFPAFFGAVWNLVGSLEQATEIDAGLRAMVRVRVATINGCPF